MILKLSLSLVFFSLFSCVTPPLPGMEGNVISQTQYENILNLNSEQIETYSGFYNTINMSATLLRTEVAVAQLKQQARLYQWDNSKYQEEFSKRKASLQSHSEVFVSLYTPERKHDDLHKNQTLWKIFLDVGGKRYEGKVKKIKLLTTEVQSLYPYYNRFSSPYTVTFPVSTSSLENQEVKFTLTGSVGSAVVAFK